MAPRDHADFRGDLGRYFFSEGRHLVESNCIWFDSLLLLLGTVVCSDATITDYSSTPYFSRCLSKLR